MITDYLSPHVWHQTFILFVAVVSHDCTSGYHHISCMHFAYDLERGPHAARAVDVITTSHHFSQTLADAMAVSNRDSLPPAALMAEWAVRCVYSDTIADDDSYDFVLKPVLDNDTQGACSFVAQTLGLTSMRNATRFVYATYVYVTQGRRVGHGLWPDVHVKYARCPRANTMMQLAARPVADDVDTDTAHCQAAGKALLSQAQFVLPAHGHGATL